MPVLMLLWQLLLSQFLCNTLFVVINIACFNCYCFCFSDVCRAFANFTEIIIDIVFIPGVFFVLLCSLNLSEDCHQ